MWLYTKYGFFSVTQDPHNKLRVQVRARARAHLVALRMAVLKSDLSIKHGGQLVDGDTHDYPIHPTPHNDYAFRIFMPKDEWVVWAFYLAHDIDYTNFKSAVEARECPDVRKPLSPYTELLHKVWHYTMLTFRTHKLK